MYYPKIQTMFKRTEDSKLLIGNWTTSAFAYLADLQWRCTEKINGANIRIIIKPGLDGGGGPPILVKFGGKTDSAQLHAKLVEWLQDKFLTLQMKKTLYDKFPDGAILFGEGFGAGISKGGGNYQDIQSFILFDVRVGDWWLEWPNVIDVAKTLGLQHVPLVGHFNLAGIVKVVERGIGSSFGDFEAEGLVAEPVVPLFARNGDRVITKLKTSDFLRIAKKG